MTIELRDLLERNMEFQHRLAAGEEVTLLHGGEVIGTVVPAKTEPPPAAPQRIGFAKGSFLWTAPDFDAPLPDEFWLGGDP